MVIAARRDHAHAKVASDAHVVKAEHVVIKVQRLVQIRDIQMKMSDSGPGRHRFVEPVIRFQLSEQALRRRAAPGHR